MTIRVGVIGVGMMGAALIESMNDHGAPVAMKQS
ncbi:MAG TPA: NAD(P)-binding domain-containing protein [Mycobacterium sp.]